MSKLSEHEKLTDEISNILIERKNDWESQLEEKNTQLENLVLSMTDEEFQTIILDSPHIAQYKIAMINLRKQNNIET